jgi:hypothetical protein
LQNEIVGMVNLNSEWFDEYRWDLYYNDYIAFVEYIETHENNKSMVLFPKLRHCITDINEFIIHWN